MDVCEEYRIPIRKVFVSNLAYQTTTRDLEEFFSIFGEIDKCFLKRERGKSIFAFITYSDVESAKKAMIGGSDRIYLRGRIPIVQSADLWHQPDNIENKKRFSVTKKKNSDDIKNTEELFESAINFDSLTNVLNDDCLLTIFSYLSILDRVNIERVCKRWRVLSQESWKAAKRLDFVNDFSYDCQYKNINTYTLKKIFNQCGQVLTHLNISMPSNRLRSSTITIIGKYCTKLQYIDISALQLSSSGIFSLMANCSNFKKMVIGSLTNQCENCLFNLFFMSKNLRYLGITRGDYISGKCLGYLCENTIEEIYLKRCHSLLSTYLNDAIGRFINLQSLTIQGCICVTDETLQEIGKKTLIKNLEVSGHCPLILENAMSPIINLVNLQRLILHTNNAVSDDLLFDISINCKLLNFLDVSNCRNISDMGISSLDCLSKLETLHMASLDKVTDEALPYLKNLKKIDCHNCPRIENRGVIRLIKYAQNLASLDLMACTITDSMFEIISATIEHRTTDIVLEIVVDKSLAEKGKKYVQPLLKITGEHFLKNF